jgi:hypothetical protein
VVKLFLNPNRGAEMSVTEGHYAFRELWLNQSTNGGEGAAEFGASPTRSPCTLHHVSILPITAEHFSKSSLFEIP